MSAFRLKADITEESQSLLLVFGATYPAAGSSKTGQLLLVWQKQD
jgi:hypothetical protein